MSHAKRRHQRHPHPEHPSLEEHPVPHPRACSIHQATLRHWCALVNDPLHPGETIPLYRLEQNQRAALYRRHCETQAAPLREPPA
ncbi:MAG: hypothetical protein ACKO5F_10800 [Synechococcus sp.]